MTPIIEALSLVEEPVGESDDVVVLRVDTQMEEPGGAGGGYCSDVC